MRSTLPLLGVLGLVGALASVSACQTIECGPGTIDRGGECEPADLAVGTAKCGPNTELRGDQCVPKLAPTECDPNTTQSETDPVTGVTKCIGTGGGGCSAPIACPDPANGKQTICGQIYNFIDDTPFAAAGATGAKCASTATEGPCALKITAKNALGLVDLSPPPREVYIDDCGRYRVSDITPPTALTVLEFDDADPAKAGLAGVTTTTLVGFRVADINAIGARARGFEAFVVKETTIDFWGTGGLTISPPLAVYAAIFRAHGCDLATGKCNGDRDRLTNQEGVTLTGTPTPLVSKYFAGTTRQQLASASITKTNSNGAIVANLVPLPASTGFSATGGLPDTCQWLPNQIGAAFPNRVLFQVFRPVDNGAQKCTQ